MTEDQASSREKTLLIALLLSAPGPIATGAAVLLSRSSTQLADFLRRTVELAALAVAWWAFRVLRGGKPATAEQTYRLERAAGLCTAAAMGVSGFVLLAVAISRFPAFEPGGNVYPGLVIAVLGFFVNGWFWRRYRGMTLETYSTIIAAQRDLYRAKVVVDAVVIVALTAVAVAANAQVTRYLDLLGSGAVAAFLMWSSVRTAVAAASRR